MAADGKGDYKLAMPQEDSDDYKPPVRPQQKQSSTSGIDAALTQSALWPVLAYCSASILMTASNKYVLSGYHFNLNFFLLMVQSVVCISAIALCKQFKVITYRDFNADEAKKWFPVSCLLVLMIYTGSKALQFLSIPVYTIFKNLTIIVIAYGEVIWFGGSVTPLTLASFGLMVISSIVAAWSDISAAVYGYGAASSSTTLSTLNAGYLWMAVNCFATAAYVLGMRKRIKLTNFKDFDTMFYNNLLSIPVLFICSLVLEDWSAANVNLNFPLESRNSLIAAIIFSGLNTVGISYTSAWCVRTTSSTTYSMVGALNKLPIALSGLVFFGDPVTFFSVTAIMLGFVAGIVYAVAKMQQSKNKSSGLPMTAIPMSSSSSSASAAMKN
ncbi:GDP-mannose transporter [Protomyces lactucae-debilis]|uniref:GDP-mannose transporter n=1 Tax=Protomyces lactucae-debilis TaxID=2754530 RepID=A0A1Y2FNK7_PROLT|nr:GDP-mannose transporter [Protomyces lactucae-debilis]ORY85543.1 GDP-mannose transporter [Protomyces lactucae-debilis]